MDLKQLSDFLNEKVETIFAYVQAKAGGGGISNISFLYTKEKGLQCYLSYKRPLLYAERRDCEEAIMNLGFDILASTMGVEEGKIIYEVAPFQSRAVVTRTYFKYAAETIIGDVLRKGDKLFHMGEVISTIESVTQRELLADISHGADFTISAEILPEMGERYVIR